MIPLGEVLIFNDFFFEDKNICNLSYSISWFDDSFIFGRFRGELVYDGSILAPVLAFKWTWTSCTGSNTELSAYTYGWITT